MIYPPDIFVRRWNFSGTLGASRQRACYSSKYAGLQKDLGATADDAYETRVRKHNSKANQVMRERTFKRHVF